MTIHDAAVIGAGPAGMTAALYLARSGLKTLLFEQMTPGGQILATEGLENYPGFPHGVKGYELADYMDEQIAPLGIDRKRAEVCEVGGEAGSFLIKTDEDSETFLARTIIVCAGAKHRHLGLGREDELIGRGVSYCALCDGGFYRNKDVAVVGGGNSALEETLYLARIVKKVHLIHRRDTFRGAKIYQDKIEQMPDKIEVHRDTIITQLLGDKDLDGLEVENLKTGQKEELQVNGLFIYVGFIPMAGFLPDAIEKDNQGFVVTDTEMRTNIPGIYAAGDIRSKLTRQVITACGDGATAAQAAFVFLEQLHA
ncbi:MAG: thioredoxin-disulfide reductase [Desulfovibrio sp.]|nr:thioredoxin-disulfide reductase [Desulfovibrio sp.]